MTTKTPSWNDIRKRATAFAAEWASATDERAQSQLFWVEFFAIFSIDFPMMEIRIQVPMT